MNRTSLLAQLSTLLRQKESKRFYAERLGISIDEVNELIAEIRSAKPPTVRREDECSQVLLEKGLNDGYVVAGGWIRDTDMSIRFNKKQEVESLQDDFMEFLKTFKPKERVITKSIYNGSESNGCLIINIQDAHFNKYDINGQNSIAKRLRIVYNKILNVIAQANTTSNLHKIVYVLGSDIFNSEWTDMTTKGTPQSNVGSYQESFNMICQHQVDVIEMLLEHAEDVEIIYCAGNHDEFVGWHMMSWLQMYFRNQNISFDISPKYTKYIKFSNTAMCFNHGDGAKPEVVARNFPIAFKEHWSKCDNFIIFGGDKHTELSRDLGGIKFYRIPALSTAQSKWDSKNGYEAKAELTAFLIYEDGAMDIIKRPI